MFTTTEINLMVIYNLGTRPGLITELASMVAYLADEETELKELACSALTKLKGISDAEYGTLNLDPNALKGR